MIILLWLKWPWEQAHKHWGSCGLSPETAILPEKILIARSESPWYFGYLTRINLAITNTKYSPLVSDLKLYQKRIFYSKNVSYDYYFFLHLNHKLIANVVNVKKWFVYVLGLPDADFDKRHANHRQSNTVENTCYEEIDFHSQFYCF